jgi:hypothetical protein
MKKKRWLKHVKTSNYGELPMVNAPPTTIDFPWVFPLGIHQVI